MSRAKIISSLPSLDQRIDSEHSRLPVRVLSGCAGRLRSRSLLSKRLRIHSIQHKRCRLNKASRFDFLACWRVKAAVSRFAKTRPVLRRLRRHSDKLPDAVAKFFGGHCGRGFGRGHGFVPCSARSGAPAFKRAFVLK